MVVAANDELDRQDMARLRAGHDAALNALMERHAQRLFHYLLRQLNSESDASDLAQETFVLIYQNRARFDSAQRFTTWLYAIATNLLRDRYRWLSRHPQVSLDAESDGGGTILDTLESNSPTPRENLDSDERAEQVREAVQSLPVE